ncbi:MAG: hypothetical protein R3F16_25300 [Myxococcota bacterium]
MIQLVRTIGAAIAVLATFGCFEEPAFVLREAVPAPESAISPGLFLLGNQFSGFDALRACSPCERATLKLESGEKHTLHVTLGVAYPIAADDVESATIQQHYGFLSARDFFYTLECRISMAVLTDILEREERRGRAGLLIPFRDDIPVAYGTSGEGPCFLGYFEDSDDAELRAKDLRVPIRRRLLSETEIETARSNEVNLAIDMVNYYICEGIPLERPVEHAVLREIIPPDRRDEISCDF